jgi:hypothetical protein
MAAALFVGVVPWVDSFPRVEVYTPEGAFDLHNNAQVEVICICPISAKIAFTFRYSADWRTIETEGYEIKLNFNGIRDLVIAQDQNFDARACSLEGIVHEIENGRSRFVIDLGDMTCVFYAELFQVLQP